MTVEQAFNTALALIITGMGWFLKNLADKVDAIPKVYATKEEFNRLEDKITAGLNALGEKVDNGFERVYDKLDKKADK